MNEFMRKFLSEVAVFNLDPSETICFTLYCDGIMHVQLTEDGFRRCMVGRRLIGSDLDGYSHQIKFFAGSLEVVAIIESDEMRLYIESARERQRQDNEVTF